MRILHCLAYNWHTDPYMGIFSPLFIPLPLSLFALQMRHEICASGIHLRRCPYQRHMHVAYSTCWKYSLHVVMYSHSHPIWRACRPIITHSGVFFPSSLYILGSAYFATNLWKDIRPLNVVAFRDHQLRRLSNSAEHLLEKSCLSFPASCTSLQVYIHKAHYGVIVSVRMHVCVCISNCSGWHTSKFRTTESAGVMFTRGWPPVRAFKLICELWDEVEMLKAFKEFASLLQPVGLHFKPTELQRRERLARSTATMICTSIPLFHQSAL